jgi:hypothetical protein
MLWWTEPSVWWSNYSTMATCEHASSTSLSTRLQLMGGDAQSEEPGRYGPGNSALMAPKDPWMLAPETSVPMTPYGASPMPGTSVANATATVDCRWTTGTSMVQLLSFNPTLPSKPKIQNGGSGNGMPRNSAPHTCRVDAGRKDQEFALLYGGSAPPSSDKDKPRAVGTMAPAIDKDKGTCKAPGK